MSVDVYSSACKVGTIHGTGQIFDVDGIKLGHIFPSGELRDAKGFLIGRVFPSGIQAENPLFNQLTKNSANQIVLYGNVIGRMQLAWGNQIPIDQVLFAAGYLLFQSSSGLGRPQA
ncbi:MAG: hypothetical protein AAF633_12905 [Chloroflexota bacterium]